MSLKKVSFIILFIFITNLAFCETDSDRYYKKEAREFDKIARKILAPVYLALAKQIVDDYKITKGVCVDLGCGPGYLMLEMAKLTNLDFYGVDINPFMLDLADKNFDKYCLRQRLTVVKNDATNLCLKDNFADLVISRGCLPFISNKAQFFREAYRILKKGGVTFIGGGFGRNLDPSVVRKIQEKLQPAWGKKDCGEIPKMNSGKIKQILWEVGIKDYQILKDEGCPCGLWVVIHKND
jgi:ubiquinone/menaquinone biosynthesis C-methylase UbiE